MRVLCFDIGGTNVKYGVIDNEKFLEKGLFDTNADLGKEYLTNILVDMAQKMKEKYQIDGIGISCAGSVNFEKAYIEIAPDALPSFSDWDFRKIFKERVGLDCIADNDVNSFAKAECVNGAAKDFDHFIAIKGFRPTDFLSVKSNIIYYGKFLEDTLWYHVDSAMRPITFYCLQ